MDYETLVIDAQAGVARVTLNRPQARNALSREMIADLHAYFAAIRPDRSIRVVVLGGSGAAFCAGGDLKEMQADATATREQQLDAAQQLDALLAAISQAPQVVVARVHGAAVGGGVGLVCAVDIAIAAHEATLALPEVRLGIVPAMIAPYVVGRVGLAEARRLMLTGITLGGAEAAAAGLVAEACPAAELDERVERYVGAVLQCAPGALAACKELLFTVAARPPTETAAYRAELLSRLRAGEEGQEGMRAFLERRRPGWASQPRRET